MNQRTKIQWLSIDDIHPYENNPRHNDDAVQYVANSLEEFGWQQPIVVDTDGTIIAGHTRHKAAKVLGMDKVPVVVADNLTPAQVNAYRLADNKTAEIATWDDALLGIELEGLEVDFDMTEFGFGIFDGIGDDEPVPLEEIKVEEDELPEMSTPRCKRGDIWQLGEHRLICGDSTDPSVIEALMDGEEADLLLTDPPYNVDYVGKTKEALTIENDSMEDDRYQGFIADAMSAAKPNIRKGAAFYVWFAAWRTIDLFGAMRDAGLEIRQELYWIKSNITLGHQDYQWQTEPCLYGWRDGTHWFAPTRKEHNVIDDMADLRKMDKGQLIQMIEDLLLGDNETDAIRESKPQRNGEHPTMKPVSLFARLIRNSSQRGDTVLDIFAGSGTTAIACEQMGRRARMVELSEGYCDVIIERWERFTGKKAKRLVG